MNHEDHDELWNLLGKARQPKASPFFAGRVMRAVRESGEPTGILHWLRNRWYLPVTAGACAALLAIFATRSTTAPVVPAPDPLEGIAVAAAATPEIIPSLDSLLVSEDNSIWLAGDPSSLY